MLLCLFALSSVMTSRSGLPFYCDVSLLLIFCHLLQIAALPSIIIYKCVFVCVIDIVVTFAFVGVYGRAGGCVWPTL